MLDLDRMNAAAVACLGEHDFAAFCRSREGATTIRELMQLDWARAEPGVAVATVVADAFCHNMVRALTGALLSVGDGTRPPEWLGQVLAAGERDPAVRVAPPHPLCLEEVGYPDRRDGQSCCLDTAAENPARPGTAGLTQSPVPGSGPASGRAGQHPVGEADVGGVLQQLGHELLDLVR